MDELSALESRETSRLVALSDGVVAIAITLLVIDITVPRAPADASSAVLAASVLAQWDEFLGFVLSFFVIGLYWVMHRRVFTYIETQNRTVVWLNLVFLLLVAFLPYATSLFSTYPTQFGVSFYAGVMAATGYSLAVLWLYAAREQLVHSGIYSRALQIQIARYFITPTFFLFSVVLAVWSPLLAIGSWFLLFPINGAFEARISSALPETDSQSAT